MKTEKNPDILVVQFRTDQTEAHEQSCFLEELPQAADRMKFVSAIDLQFPETLVGINGVILAGSGEFMLSREDGKGVWLEPTFDFIQKVLDANIPFLGVCFGYQLLCLQQGGDIIRDEQMRETGTYNVHRLESGEGDHLFKGIPNTFGAQFGHQDTAVNHPEHLIPLSRTNRVEVNAVKVTGKQAWGVLFHPELSRERMRSRLRMSSPNYLEGGKTVEDVLSQFEDVPESTKTLHNFIDIIDGKIGS